MLDKTRQVGIRISEAAHARLSAQAAARGLPLATFLRECLEEQERSLLGELRSMREALDALATRPAPTNGSPGPNPASSQLVTKAYVAVAVETLLTLRKLAQPSVGTYVQNEMKRLGIEVWTG